MSKNLNEHYNQQVEAQLSVDFEELAKPLIKFLCENYNPHTIIVIDGTNAQLFEGVITTGEILDYLKD